MITLSLYDQTNQLVDQRNHQTETYLSFKERAYQEGDYIVVKVNQPESFIWVQVDEAISPSLLYLKGNEWLFPIIMDEELKRAYSPKIFGGQRHYIRAWLPTTEEINSYRNLALNAHDQKDISTAYPHAHANVETRNDSTFFARNAIDGMIANDNHGSFPYQSWGINQQKDATFTVEFGRKVLIDKVAFILRADYPHDSYWTNVTLVFSDGEEISVSLNDASDRQFVTFHPKTTMSITLKNLIKHEDDSPFPALTEFEAFGKELNE